MTGPTEGVLTTSRQDGGRRERLTDQRLAAGKPIRAVQGRRGRRTWQRLRAATRARAGRRVEGCALALSVVGRDSVGVTRVPLRRPIPASGTVPRVISLFLLGLGGLLRAVALGSDGCATGEELCP